MSYRLLKEIKRLQILLLTIMLIALTGCKKEVTEVTVDAYAQLDAKTEYKQGIYSLEFTLQDYPYQEVGVRSGTSKNAFSKNEGLTQNIANEVATHRYAVFYNTLAKNTIYYYQIYVKDATSGREVYSDVFSFTTNP